jgi:CheY-like chemotaxis protein/AraC-like DNA-binding protein
VRRITAQFAHAWFRPPRLLIIDDLPASVGLLLAYLGDRDLDILVALDGRDGLAKARNGQPDVILLDVSMPDMDGFAVCEQLKADPRTADIPVIFLSASNEIDDKLQCFKVGGADYITKPFLEQEVLARVQVQLQTRQRFRLLKAIAVREVLEDKPGETHRDEHLFTLAVCILKEQMAEPPGLVQLAHQIGTNERKITEIFRQRVGMTVFDYLTELRLDTARHLLAAGGTQVQLIADLVGYRNPGDFTRAFRRRHQMSPREYRQACNAQAGDFGD